MKFGEFYILCNPNRIYKMESQQTTENTNKKVIAMDEKDLSDHEDDLHRKRKKKVSLTDVQMRT